MVIYRHNAVRCRRHADRREEVPHRLADKEVGLTIGSLLGGGKTSSPRLCGRRVPTRLTRGCHRPFDFRVIRGTGGGFDLGANPRQVRVGASLALRTRSWPRPSADRTSHICRSTSFEAPPILASRRPAVEGEVPGSPLASWWSTRALRNSDSCDSAIGPSRRVGGVYILWCRIKIRRRE